MKRSNEMDQPFVPASTRLPELTFKVVVFAILLAVLLAASNVYLALKIGTTISASIPASILAIGILRMFKDHNVLQCNIVQTSASAGEGVAAAIAFVLPALVIIKFWTGFPYWETACIAGLGGILGVMFSIPLRRVLLSMKTLPFPEGTAVGNVLKMSAAGGNLVRTLIYGVSAGGIVTFLQEGIKVMSDSWMLWWYGPAKTIYGMSFGFTPAALAAGYIVGTRVAISVAVGVVIGWLIGIPVIGHLYGIPHGLSAAAASMHLWSAQERFVGVGTMLIGGAWTLIRLLKPVGAGLAMAMSGVFSKGGTRAVLPRTERDIPMSWVLGTSLVVIVLIYAGLLMYMLNMGFPNTTQEIVVISLVSVGYMVVMGFLLATMCGYFTGLVGSTNNPLSGVMIMSVLLLALIYAVMFHPGQNHDAAKVVGLIILMTAIIGSCASIANENMQDLKAGLMVGATPWKQQLMLLIGVVAAALVVGPVLELLFNAYGIGGVFPRVGMDPSQGLGAPQALLISAVAKGVITHNLDWNMINTGIVIGFILLIIDELLRRNGRRLPVLAVGLGLYLPPMVTIPLIAGGFVRTAVQRRLKRSHAADEGKEHEQRGILLACGIVAGGSLMGVFLAIPFVLMGSANALSIVGKGYQPYADVLGLFSAIFLGWWLYKIVFKSLKKAGNVL